MMCCSMPYTPAPLPRKLSKIPLPPGMTLQDGQPLASKNEPVISPNEIVPDDVQMRLMALDDTLTRAYFEVGDIANELVARAPQITVDGRRKIVTIGMVHRAVGYFCHRSERTIRYYADTASFFTPAVRSEFDMLPFSHFALARNISPVRWREILEYARQNPSISEEGLRLRFVTVNPSEEQRVEMYESYGIGDVIESELDKPSASEDDQLSQLVEGHPSALPVRTRGVSALLLSHLSNMADSLDRLQRNVPTEDTRERIRQIVDNVRDLIVEVQSDILKHVVV